MKLRVLTLVLVALVTSACGANGEKECEEHAAHLAQRGVRVTTASCSVPDANVALRTLAGALNDLPSEQAPASFEVRFESSRGYLHEPRVEAASQALVVDPASRAASDRSIWLHELAHVHARGPNVKRDLATKRLREAIEEGFADYFAASALRSSLLGAAYGREVRDLAQAPALPSTEWATLPFPGAPFDEHRFGSALAARAFAEHGYDLPLARAGLEALRATSRNGARSPAQLALDLSAAGGERRHDLHLLLVNWLPIELRPEEPAP